MSEQLSNEQRVRLEALAQANATFAAMPGHDRQAGGAGTSWQFVVGMAEEYVSFINAKEA